MQKRNYKGSLRLDWINKDLSLYYEIDEKEGKGVRPVWVQKNDIRVAEPRILKFQKSYGDTMSGNMLIKGDNLLVLRSLVEMFKGKPEKEKVKCIYIDPPFNSGNAFKYYDDNLQHSEWLTMMRDRLYLLRKLMRKDGVIFVHIDYTELAYMKVLLDELFGRKNYVAQINWQRVPEGRTLLGQGQADITVSSEYLLLYALNKKQGLLNKEIKKYTEATDKVLQQYFLVLDTTGEKKLLKKFTDNQDNAVEVYEYDEYKLQSLPKKLLREDKNKYFALFSKKFNQVVQSVGVQEESSFQQRIIGLLKSKTKLYSAKYIVSKGKRRGAETEDFFVGGRKLLFAKNYCRLENGQIYREADMNDFWSSDEINVTGTADEGGVTFKRSKKPEALIKRIIDLSTLEGDLVLDSFAGSGTTGAVAHKMGRHWIMVEIGRHAEELVIPRIQRVVSGKDQSGISKDVSWHGGGGFKYYQLGESVIHEQDMNWKLKAEEMAEAVFLHFQYRPTKIEWLEKENMYLGEHQSARYHFALSFASREVKTLTENLYEKIVAGLDKEKFKHLTIFTNVAVSVSPESLDDRVMVKKIPAAILREYNLI